MDWYWILLIAIGCLLVLFIVSIFLYKPFFKRFYDLFLSSLAILFLSPLLVVLIVCGLIAMRGNPFFLQTRPGKNEKLFRLIKFRSMSFAKDDKGNLLPNEKRLNKYGRFLRTTSLDELPELFNIFIGDMSFVGPRPLLPEYLPYYKENERVRHRVRPGLTGLAQVSGRNNIRNWEERFAFDIQYVENMSLFFDIKIMINTFFKVLRRKDIVSGEKAVVGRLDDERKKE